MTGFTRSRLTRTRELLDTREAPARALIVLLLRQPGKGNQAREIAIQALSFIAAVTGLLHVKNLLTFE